MHFCTSSIPNILPFRLRAKKHSASVPTLAEPKFPWYGPEAGQDGLTTDAAGAGGGGEEAIFSASATSPEARKPVEKVPEPAHLPNLSPDDAAKALLTIVEQSATQHDAFCNLEMDPNTINVAAFDWIHRLIPGIERLAAEWKMGNFVVERETGKRHFEYMPLYARVGMHLVFYGKAQQAMMGYERVQDLLKAQSIKQGKIYDSPTSVASIPSFAKQYAIPLDELLEPDLAKYASFNDFFYRKLQPGARPVSNASDPLGVCSAADCRLAVYPSTSLALKFWIKGDEFTIPSLLDVPPDSPEANEFSDAAMAIFRLAPQDYHRFHWPVDGVVSDEPKDIEGTYYTVNPQTVTQIDFDVFTANRRSVVYVDLDPSTTGGKKRRAAVVAIGALLVGGIVWIGAEKGNRVKRGEEMGYFAYGGSTLIVLFPKDSIRFNEDLVKYSEEPIEALVKVGSSLGQLQSN